MSTYLASEESKWLFSNVSILLNVISLLGSVLFLLEARDVLPRWYLAIPLWIILLALLPPCSAMVFLSLKGRSGPIDVCVAVSSAASILSIFSLLFHTWKSQNGDYGIGTISPDSLLGYLDADCRNMFFS